MRFSHYLFTIFCLMGFTLQAFADKNLSLNDATLLALQSNPDIAVALRERDIENGQALQASARPNPTLSGQVQDLRSQNRISVFTISQQLETAAKRDKRMAAADISMAMADTDIRVSQADISAKVYAAFYQVLAAQQALTLAQDLLQVATTSRETTAKRVLAGKISPVEETKAKVAEASLKIDLAIANQQLAAAKQRLGSLWAKNDSLDNDFVAIGDLKALQNMPALNDLINQLADSPRLKKAALVITQKQAFSNIEQSKQTPDITLSLGAQRNEELGGITQAIIGLSIPIPVFDKNQGNLQSAKAREFQAVDEKAALENMLKTELVNAYNRRQLQLEAVNTYQNDILPGAQSAYAAARKGFEFGKFSFLEVLDAQRTLFQAKTQHIQALTLARLAEADIHTLVGNSIFKETP